MPDYRWTLNDIRTAWEGCTRCELGVQRMNTGGHFVFGEGAPGGVMFIGEGPGETEESMGSPFVGPSGQILRAAIAKLGLDKVYITNVVSCRSCSQAYSSEGQPIMRYDRKLKARVPFIKDEAPTPLQVASCLPRLHEEIYLVDPVLIVCLGGEAAKAVSGKHIAITQERGSPREIEIPGAAQLPSLTAKMQKWRRKVKGEYVMPTVQNTVRYLMLPVLHPAYVLRKWKDKSHGNPFDRFVEDMKLAANIYNRYMLEVYGVQPGEHELETSDLLNEVQNG